MLGNDIQFSQVKSGSEGVKGEADIKSTTQWRIDVQKEHLGPPTMIMAGV